MAESAKCLHTNSAGIDHPDQKPETPGVKVGNSLRGSQQLFVSKYISKVGNVCGNMEDSGIGEVKLELGAGVGVCTEQMVLRLLHLECC